uniref:Uncharacterized protein n=1 Tax=Chelonoidis abingdonii TaxID=106734 RepID=A0A8C0G9M5_CHEAB
PPSPLAHAASPNRQTAPHLQLLQRSYTAPRPVSSSGAAVQTPDRRRRHAAAWKGWEWYSCARGGWSHVLFLLCLSNSPYWEVVESPSLDIFKSRLDKCLSGMV